MPRHKIVTAGSVPARQVKEPPHREPRYPFSLPRASKNGTGKNNASGEQVEKPRLLKFAATVGGFLRWAQTDTVRG